MSAPAPEEGQTTPDPSASARELVLPLANGLQLAGRAWGAATGPQVLALHGWMDNAASFDLLAPLLPGLQLVALDLPGHGHSDHRGPGASYDFIGWLPDILQAASALGWERFALLGHSLGGAIALCLAGLAPQRITRVAAIDSFGPLSASAETTATRVARALAEAPLGAPPEPPYYRSRVAMAARLRSAIDGLSREGAAILIERGTRESAQGFTWCHDLRLRNPSLHRLTEAHVEAIFRRIGCPALVLRARAGWPVPAEVLQRRLSWIAPLAFAELEGEHHVHLGNPEAVAERVGPFLLHDDCATDGS